MKAFIPYYLLKRIFDVGFALVGLLVLSPMWIAIWVAIWIEDGIPILIKQKRIGKDGKLFNAYKFRSMDKSSLHKGINFQAKEDDPRITKVGRILRNTAMDESPQLMNILRGEMSFVGPRPLLKSEVEVNKNIDTADITGIPGYEQRIALTPGLTGFAQLYHERDITREEKFKYDLLYTKYRCLLVDMKLILLSLLVTFAGRWERRGAKFGLLRKDSNFDIV